MDEKESKVLQGKATITVSHTRIDKVLEDSMEEEVISVRKFETEPAYVSVSAGVTKAMAKKYEFLRLDVGVKIPCYTEEITEVEKMVSSWVDDKLSAKLDEVKQIRNAV